MALGRFEAPTPRPKAFGADGQAAMVRTYTTEHTTVGTASQSDWLVELVNGCTEQDIPG